MNKQENRIYNLTVLFDKVLKELDIDVNSEHFKDTPNRMARMYVNELFSGLYNKEPKFTVFSSDSNEMVFLGGISVNSMCGHHFLPFRGTCSIGYIPDGRLVGISKLARITNYFSRRPQVQEDLTSEIAEYLMDKLEPKGVAVYIQAKHMCMSMRGAMETNSIMKTTALRGCFLEDKTVAEEFKSNIKV